MAPNDPNIQSLISRIYDGVMEEGAWSGITAAFAQTLSATSAVLKVQDNNDNARLLDMTDNLAIDAKQQDWAAHWHAHDLWVEKSLTRGFSEIVLSHELVADSALRKTDFYGDWIRHLDIFYMMGAVFPIGNDALGVLGIHRPEDAPAFDAADKRLFAELLPHLIRACRLRQCLTEHQTATETALRMLQRSGHAVVVLGTDRFLLYANKRAERLFRAGAGIDLRGGKLSVANVETSLRLERLIHHHAAGEFSPGDAGGSRLFLARPGRLPLILSVMPISASRSKGWEDPAALVLIRDPEDSAVEPDLLRQLFGLTSTESTVAAALAEGHDTEEIARRLGIGLGTVRSHLKHILQKTGTHKQAQLVALIHRCAQEP